MGMDQATKKCISIHAPAWGATKAKLLAMTALYYFNPRSRVGSDDGAGTIQAIAGHFNPRSRVGSDNNKKSYSQGGEHFNPRSRVGSDPYIYHKA